MALQQELARARLFQNCVGLVDAHPSWKLDTNALAAMLNVRVYDDEVMTTNGRSKENSTAIEATGAVDAMEYGVDSGGTERLVVSVDKFEGINQRMYWYVNGNTKTLINKGQQTGNLTAELTGAGGLAVTGTATNWSEDVQDGDWFYFNDDGISAATRIDNAGGDTVLGLSAVYAGSATAGAYTIIEPQSTSNKPQILKYMDRWFFVNGADNPKEWTPSTDKWRDVGHPVGVTADMVSGAGAGSLSADSWYSYKFSREDRANGTRYGNASGPFALDCGANGSTSATAWPSFRAWQTHWRVYRTIATSSEAAATAAQHFHLTSVPVSTVSAGSWNDTLGDVTITASIANISDLAPFENDQPPSAAESVAMHKDRLLWTKGSDLYIGGLKPYDYHSDAKGRYEPDYAPSDQIRYIGRDTRDQAGCQGVFEQNGIMHYLRSRTLYALRSESDDPTIWQTVVRRYDVGSEAFWSVAQDGQYTYWLGRLGGRLGILRYNGATVDNIGKLVQGSIDKFTVGTLSAAAAGCSEQYYYLSVNTSDGDKTFEWNTDRGNMQGAWSEKDWFAESFCKGTTLGYSGDDSGFVYQLEQGLDDAGSAITRRIETAAVRFRSQDPHSDRYWKVAGRLYAEVYSVSGFAAMSAYYKLNEGAWTQVTAGWPISAAAGATVYKSVFLDDVPNARGFEFKFESSGTAEDWTFRDLWFDGQVKPEFRADGTEE